MHLCLCVLRVSACLFCLYFNFALVRHSFKENAESISDKQLAYRAGYSTELLLIHLTETRRRAVDSGLVVAVAFVDFKKAFDSVCNTVLESKLEREFGFGSWKENIGFHVFVVGWVEPDYVTLPLLFPCLWCRWCNIIEFVNISTVAQRPLVYGG